MALDIFLIQFVIIAQKIFGRAEHVINAAENSAGILDSGREGDHFLRPSACGIGKIFLHCPHRGIVRGHILGKIGKQLFDFFVDRMSGLAAGFHEGLLRFRIIQLQDIFKVRIGSDRFCGLHIFCDRFQLCLAFLQDRADLLRDLLQRAGRLDIGNEILDLHMIFRDRSGLINAQHRDSGQRLHALHVMDQHFLRCQTHSGYRQRQAGRQIQPFRDHADHGSDHAGNAVAECGADHEILLIEQQTADGNDDHADDLDQTVQRADHLRLLLHGLFGGLERQFGNIGILSDRGQLRKAGAGYDKAAGEQPTSLRLFDLIGFPGQERFIDMNAAVYDNGVRRDLCPGLQDHDIIEHQGIGQDFRLLSLPDRGDLCRAHDLQIVQYFFRTDLLNDADQRVGHDHAHEEHVAVGSDDQEKDRQDHEDHVEIGERIAQDDLFDRAGTRIDRDVHKAAPLALPDLIAGEPVFRIHIDVRNIDSLALRKILL